MESNTYVVPGSPTRILVLLLLGISAGCTADKTLTDDDLRSEVTSIRSTASETWLFIPQIREQRVTGTFAREHLKYLFDQNEETQCVLAKASGTEGKDAILSEARSLSARLSQELSVLSQSGGNPPVESAKRIDQILSESESLQASLQ